MTHFFKKILAVLIVLLSVLVLWPLWPSPQYRELFLAPSLRLLLLSAVVYGVLALVDFIYDRRKSGML